MSSRPALDRPSLRRRTVPFELRAVCALLAAATLLVALAYGIRIHGRLAPFGHYSGQVAAYLVGVGGSAAVYAHLRRLDVGTGLPRRDRFGAALASVVAPAAVAVLAAAVLNAGFGAPFSAVVTHQSYSPRGGVEGILRLTAAQAAFEGVGFGLICVVTYALVRRYVVSKPRRGVALAGVLLAYFHAALWDGATTLVSFPSLQRLVAVPLLSAATVAAGVSLGLAYRSVVERSLRPAYRPAFVPVYALGLFALVVAVTLVMEFSDAVEHLLWVCAFAAAAFGYERTDSVWVSMSAIAAFRLGMALVGYAEAVLGLSGVAP